VIANSRMRCRDYRHYFMQRRAHLAAAGGEWPTAAVTWTLSADHAEQLAPGGAIVYLFLVAVKPSTARHDRQIATTAR